MPGTKGQNAETGIFVKVGPNASGLPATAGWRTLRIGVDAEGIRRDFRRQARLVALRVARPSSGASSAMAPCLPSSPFPTI